MATPRSAEALDDPREHRPRWESVEQLDLFLVVLRVEIHCAYSMPRATILDHLRARSSCSAAGARRQSSSRAPSRRRSATTNPVVLISTRRLQQPACRCIGTRHGVDRLVVDTSGAVARVVAGQSSCRAGRTHAIAAHCHCVQHVATGIGPRTPRWMSCAYTVCVVRRVVRLFCSLESLEVRVACALASDAASVLLTRPKLNSATSAATGAAAYATASSCCSHRAVAPGPGSRTTRPGA